MDDTSAAEPARRFATLFADGDFADAADLLSEDGRRHVVDAYPDDLEAGQMDSADVLEQYWWGLRGQYGEPDGISELRVRETGEVTVTVALEDGTETATLDLDGDGVSAFSFDPAYERPSYADEDAFTEREVTVDAGDVTLEGLLSVPDDGDAVPGVLLVHGAGVHDPDGTVGNSKLLKDVAWGLATEGVASLRYEKRLADHEIPDEELTLDAVVTDDAVAAANRLAAADAVDEDALFVAGHSQGGMCAPRIADRHGGLAGIVNLDGRSTSSLPPEHADVIKYEFEIDGDLDEEQAAQLEADRETLRTIAAGEFDDEETLMGRPGVWHRSLQAYDPVATATDAAVPVFVLKTDGADEATQPELAAFFREEYEAWRDADLPAGSRVERYRDVDHYFQSVSPPTNPLSVYFGGNVVDTVISDLVEWISAVGPQ